MTKGETVLVTAGKFLLLFSAGLFLWNGYTKTLNFIAAGGAGQIAVQLAKLAGNHVIGTCSSDDKVAMLKEMGCDRVINYKKEDFKAVMKKEYPRGVDIIFESVGGKFFEICLKSLAVRGRLIVIGTIASYTGPDGMAGDNVNTLKLLGTSRTVAGFFMPDYMEFSASHMANMIKLVNEGKLKVLLDNGGLSGIDQVADAVAYLHSGKNKGKVVVSLVDAKSSKI